VQFNVRLEDDLLRQLVEQRLGVDEIARVEAPPAPDSPVASGTWVAEASTLRVDRPAARSYRVQCPPCAAAMASTSTHEHRVLSVVLVSGDPAEQARARAAGILEFLAKPLDADALIAAVERYCGRRAA
jgi:hypothetical protein